MSGRKIHVECLAWVEIRPRRMAGSETITLRGKELPEEHLKQFWVYREVYPKTGGKTMLCNREKREFVGSASSSIPGFGRISCSCKRCTGKCDNLSPRFPQYVTSGIHPAMSDLKLIGDVHLWIDRSDEHDMTLFGWNVVGKTQSVPTFDEII